jgi:hypothetical protein
MAPEDGQVIRLRREAVLLNDVIWPVFVGTPIGNAMFDS